MKDFFVKIKINICKERGRGNWKGGSKAAFIAFIYSVNKWKYLHVSRGPTGLAIICRPLEDGTRGNSFPFEDPNPCQQWKKKEEKIRKEWRKSFFSVLSFCWQGCCSLLQRHFAHIFGWGRCDFYASGNDTVCMSTDNSPEWPSTLASHHKTKGRSAM